MAAVALELWCKNEDVTVGYVSVVPPKTIGVKEIKHGFKSENIACAPGSKTIEVGRVLRCSRCQGSLWFRTNDFCELAIPGHIEVQA